MIERINKLKILIYVKLILVTHSCCLKTGSFYKTKKRIEITSIVVKKISTVLYTKSGSELNSVEILRHDNKKSYIIKYYNDSYDTIKSDKSKSLLKDFTSLSEKIEFATSEFDNIAQKLNTLNIDKINSSHDFNIMDGSTYYLSFSGDNYTINLNSNAPELSTKKRGLEDFLTICNEVWNLSNRD